MKGEYIGADGRTYRWERQESNTGAQSPWYRLQVVGGYWSEGPYVEDWPAARAALDSLIEQEQGEWVELGDPIVDKRIRRDGSEPQERGWRLAAGHCTLDHWESAEGSDWVDVYRAGLAQADELRQAVLEYPGKVHEPGYGHRGDIVDRDWLARILALAKGEK